MFARWKKNGSGISGAQEITSEAPQPDYEGNKILTALLNDQFVNDFFKLVNHNITKNTSPSTRGKIHSAMLKDLPRMEYYIDGYYVSFPGNIEQSLANFHETISQKPARSWLLKYIDAISAFLHQGVFVDICESIPYWEDQQGKRWDIRMISLDQNRSKNSFDISSQGIIKITAQSGVSNLILKNGDIIITDRNLSQLQLQISLLMVKGGGGSCLMVNNHNLADKAILNVHCQGKM